MRYKAPGKGLSLFQLQRMFPDEAAAREWFETYLWPDGIKWCPHCGTDNTYPCSHAKMPYRCRDCKRYFSVKTGTLMAGSPLPLLTWVYAIYLDTTSLKGVSSMKLHRDLEVTQRTAWFMLQRIREAFAMQGPEVRFEGPVEADESYFGGLEKNKHNSKRMKAGRGAVGKTAVIAVKDRKTKQVAAKVIGSTDVEAVQSFIADHVEPGAEVYTDDAAAYRGLENHQTVRHSVREYVDRHIHAQGIESFWSMLKRAHKGTFHKLSPKHLQRYVDEFAGRQNLRELDTLTQMVAVTCGLAGRRLKYQDLITPNGLPSGARLI